MIMARRLTWSGIPVKAVVEIRPFPSGLTRNIVQCLNDFNIPLYLGHTVSKINGADRVESVEISPLVDGVPDSSRSFTIECDTVLLSAGLIPENELSKRGGVTMNMTTGGPLVDAWRMTNIPGVFAGGNVLHVHDLADYASDEAALAGRHILDYLNGKRPGREFPVTAGGNLRYVTPNEYIPGEKTQFFMRSLIVEDDAELIVSLDGQEIMRKKLRFVKPPEMLSVEVPGELTARGGQLSFALNGGGR